jgi:hypothetical protein
VLYLVQAVCFTLSYAQVCGALLPLSSALVQHGAGVDAMAQLRMPALTLTVNQQTSLHPSVASRIHTQSSKVAGTSSHACATNLPTNCISHLTPRARSVRGSGTALEWPSRS